jgi:hypothetical protein
MLSDDTPTALKVAGIWCGCKAGDYLSCAVCRCAHDFHLWVHFLPKCPLSQFSVSANCSQIPFLTSTRPPEFLPSSPNFLQNQPIYRLLHYDRSTRKTSPSMCINFAWVAGDKQVGYCALLQTVSQEMSSQIHVSIIHQSHHVSTRNDRTSVREDLRAFCRLISFHFHNQPVFWVRFFEYLFRLLASILTVFRNFLKILTGFLPVLLESNRLFFKRHRFTIP